MDFSGDDGDPQKPGASKWLVGTWLLSTENDLLHNQGVVLSVKKLIGCRRDAELKYRSLKRHPQRDKALKLLSQLKVRLVVVPVLKERITEDALRNPKNKRLINLIHSFPLYRLLDYLGQECPDAYFQLVFDEIGWAGSESGIKKSFQNDKRFDWSEARSDWLLFVKSGANLMVQLADVFAGLAHEYIESLRGKELPPCRVCWIKGIRDCRYRRNRKTPGQINLMRVLYSFLLKDDKDKVHEVGFVPRPPEIAREYLFVDCLFGGK